MICFSLPPPLDFLFCPSHTRTVARSFEEAAMTETLWIGAVTVMVFGYLVYALLVPENF